MNVGVQGVVEDGEICGILPHPAAILVARVLYERFVKTSDEVLMGGYGDLQVGLDAFVSALDGADII